MIIAGDADVVQHGHLVELYKLFGGGGIGELSMPDSQLAILPGNHAYCFDKKNGSVNGNDPRFS